MPAEKQPLGSILVSREIISTDELQDTLDRQQHSEQRLGRLLVERGILSEIELALALSLQFGLPFVRLTDQNLEPRVPSLIPPRVLRSNGVLPLMTVGDRLVVAVSDPVDVAAIDELEILAGMSVQPVIAIPSEITHALNERFGTPDPVKQMVDEISEDPRGALPDTPTRDYSNGANGSRENPVTRFVNMILTEAIQNQASDIHLEPFEHRFLVRMRRDGVLHELPSPPPELQDAVISRIKVMADLDIADTRLPQDGRFRFSHRDQPIDIRVSTVPTVHGESVVLRVLGRNHVELQIEYLGMSESMQRTYRRVLGAPNGIVLVTGPTGAGKTTTLYAGLSDRNSPEEKIITLEDPIEYELPGLIQCQINPDTGFSFARGLRSTLRQDPDVCLVGEIRDVETAQIAVQASLTGHLVLSTVHANDAAEAVTRLVDMGLPTFLLSATLKGVIGQRLVRTICDECRTEYQPEGNDLHELGKDPEAWAGHPFVRGAGCGRCGGTGYQGRTGIFEILEITESIESLMNRRSAADTLREFAIENGMTTMREHGWSRVLDGITTVEEVLRVAPTRKELKREHHASESERRASRRE